MIRSSACQPWQPDLPGHAGDRGDPAQLHHATGHDPADSLRSRTGRKNAESVLDRYRLQLGSDVFSAQYQQEPMPPEGAMIKRQWVQRYDTPPARTAGSRVIQSWDTASKGGPENDWSVCTTWLFQDGLYYLLHVERGRYDYPELKKRAEALAQRYNPTKLLIEDTGTGSALVQELRLELSAIAVTER